MGRINLGRVLVGGVVAGLIITAGETVLNVFLLADQWREAEAALGIEETPAMIAIFVIYGFLLGIAAVWLYAAILPRFGGGLRTGVIAGGAAWFLAYFLFGLGNLAMDLFPQGLVWLSTGWGLLEILLGTVIGSWFYREPSGAGVAEPA